MKEGITNLIEWGSILFPLAVVVYFVWMLIAIDKKRKQSQLEKKQNKYEDRRY